MGNSWRQKIHEMKEHMLTKMTAHILIEPEGGTADEDGHGEVLDDGGHEQDPLGERM